MQLVNYDEGRRRIALARDKDEVQEIRDKAEALAAYARQANDKELLSWVTEIKVRAERRAGELIGEEQKAGKLAKRGGTGAHRGKQKSRAATSVPTLADSGITKSDSSRWQKMARMSESGFEKAVATAKAISGEVTTAVVLRAAAAEKPASTKKRNAAQSSQKPRERTDGATAMFVNDYIKILGKIAVPPEVLVVQLPSHLWDDARTSIDAAIDFLHGMKEALK